MSSSYGPTPSPAGAATRLVLATAPHATRPAGHACDELCLLADPATPCTCICAGRHHGAGRADQTPVTAAVAARKGRDLARLYAVAESDDEAAW